MIFPLWAMIAAAGHICNGAAFVIDKSLLSTSFKRAATYAGTVGFLGFFAVVLFFFGAGLPHASGWITSSIAGASFVLALWLFFKALSLVEASRIVPIVGSLIPILTFVGTFFFLGEVLSLRQTIGFLFLIIATVILAGGSSSKRLTQPAILSAIFSALLFAISSVAIKMGYDSDGFLTTFTFSRIVGAVAALILVASDPAATRELLLAVFPRKEKPSNDRPKPKRGALALVLTGQSLGAGGFVLVQYAISLGSAAMVNAMQAIQYAFLVLVGFVLAKRAPKLLGEDVTESALLRKSMAILIVAVGLWLAV
jgi:drug/metabolite transporter (DMT)-like permease